MICVSVGRGRHRMMMAEHKHLAENGAKLVELRLDYLRRAVSLSRLLENKLCPTVIACRRVKDGGKWRGSEKDRVMLLRNAVVERFEMSPDPDSDDRSARVNVFDYVDIEEDIADQVPRFGDAKRIISYHNFHETPEDIEAIRDRMLELDPDIIKIATMANHATDNLKLLRMSRDAKVPTIAFCMGEMGMASRLLCCKFGAPFTYASFHSERKLAPGQLSFREMQDRYRFNEINEETTLFGVIADPVAHSLSPLVHNANLKKEGLNSVYLPFRVPREDLQQFLKECGELQVKGLSVTIPHKEKVLKAINDLDEDCGGIRASNTIVFNKRKVSGYNTDCQAAMASLAEVEGRANEKKPFADKTALVLGSGGAAKAIVFGLMQGGAKVVVTSRNTASSEELAENMKCLTVDWAVRHDVLADYLINCTPVGMHPDVNECPIDQDAIREEMVVFDTVYNPEQTLLIKHARQSKCRVVTGVEMFVRQAALQFKLFTGLEPDIELMRTEMKNAISATRGGTDPLDPKLQMETPEAAGPKSNKTQFPLIDESADEEELIELTEEHELVDETAEDDLPIDDLSIDDLPIDDLPIEDLLIDDDVDFDDVDFDDANPDKSDS